MAKKSTEIIKEYLLRFPESPILTISRKVYNENKSLFKSIEAVRNVVNYYKQKKGVLNAKSLKDKRFISEKATQYNPYQLPQSYANDFTPFEISQSKVLIISDLHFPYQHNKSIELALNYGLEKKVDCILINGDLIDFANISRHERDFRARSIAEEFEAVRLFLSTLRKTFPKARIVFKYGNHDERWEKWLFVKAPEIFDFKDFELNIILKFGELKIEVVKDKKPIKIGKLTVLHGHELGGTSGGVNPARGAFLKTFSNVLIGHFHKTSQNTEVDLGGGVISAESVGCLCGLTPMFMPINRWNLGFAFVEHNIKTGEYFLHNKKIIKNKIY
jgi:predicted phosphodiesterase